VRSCALRPYVEVCPLVEVDDDTFASAKDGATPQFAYLPEIGSKYVADLGRVMSIHKSVLVSLARRAGWHADEEIRRFQAVIARRYQRFAFPNDLHASLSRLTNKLKRKHGREQSAEGTLFARVLQIRVKADPDWQANQIDVELTFILPRPELEPIPDDLVDEDRLAGINRWLSEEQRDGDAIAKRLLTESDPSCESLLWAVLVERWASLAKPVGVIASVSGDPVSEDEYTLADYWRSERLDLDYLSGYDRTE